jgi:hypothetical protein
MSERSERSLGSDKLEILMPENTMQIFVHSLFPFLAENNLGDQAKQLIEAARKSMALAEKELKYADIAFAQTEDQPNQNLAEIAAWHYEQSIKYYCEAIAHLEHAGTLELPAKYTRYVELKTKKCLEEVAYSNTRKIALGAAPRHFHAI